MNLELIDKNLEKIRCPYCLTMPTTLPEILVKDPFTYFTQITCEYCQSDYNVNFAKDDIASELKPGSLDDELNINSIFNLLPRAQRIEDIYQKGIDQYQSKLKKDWRYYPKRYYSNPNPRTKLK